MVRFSAHMVGVPRRSPFLALPDEKMKKKKKRLRTEGMLKNDKN